MSMKSLSLAGIGLPTGSVKPIDVITGGAAQGVLGPLVTKHLVSKLDVAGNLGKLSPTAVPYAPVVETLISAAAVGGGLYFAQKKSERARGHLYGVLGVATAQAAFALAKAVSPKSFSGMEDLQYGAMENLQYGILTPNPRPQNTPFGLIVPNPRPALAGGLAAAHALNMGAFAGDREALEAP